MNTLAYYLALKSIEEYQQQKQIIISKPELANLLNCSNRNTHYILKKWVEDGLIIWQSQRGRGKKSTLIFLKSLEEAAFIYINYLIQKEQLKEALTFAATQQFPTALKYQLENTVKNNLGIKHVTANGNTLDILNIPFQHSNYNINPFFVTIAAEAHILNEIFETLVRYDAETKRLVPHLAQGWDSNTNHTIWTFYLRKGVRFHNSHVLTAEDVEWTIQSLIAMKDKLPNKWLIEDITNIVVKEPYIISFHLKKPNRMFDNFLSAIYMSIIPKGTDIIDDPLVGTGPFLIHEVTKTKLVLHAFDNYFQGRAFLDQIHLWELAESIANPLTFFTNDTARNNSTINKTYSIVDNGSHFILFNMNGNGPQQNKFLRLAIRDLIDPKAMIDDSSRKNDFPSTSFLSDISNYDVYKYSAKRATSLLNNSNYNGEIISLAVLNFPDFLEDAYWISNRLKTFGINIKITPIELYDTYKESYLLSFDAIYTGESFEHNIELALLILLQNEYSIRRYLTESQCKELDITYSQMIKQEKKSSLIQIFHDLEQKLMAEGIILFTVHATDYEKFQSNLDGVQLSGYGWPLFHKLWIKPD